MIKKNIIFIIFSIILLFSINYLYSIKSEYKILRFEMRPHLLDNKKSSVEQFYPGSILYDILYDQRDLLYNFAKRFVNLKEFDAKVTSNQYRIKFNFKLNQDDVFKYEKFSQDINESLKTFMKERVYHEGLSKVLNILINSDITSLKNFINNKILLTNNLILSPQDISDLNEILLIIDNLRRYEKKFYRVYNIKNFNKNVLQNINIFEKEVTDYSNLYKKLSTSLDKKRIKEIFIYALSNNMSSEKSFNEILSSVNSSKIFKDLAIIDLNSRVLEAYNLLINNFILYFEEVSLRETVTKKNYITLNLFVFSLIGFLFFFMILVSKKKKFYKKNKFRQLVIAIS